MFFHYLKMFIKHNSFIKDELYAINRKKEYLIVYFVFNFAKLFPVKHVAVTNEIKVNLIDLYFKPKNTLYIQNGYFLKYRKKKSG